MLILGEQRSEVKSYIKRKLFPESIRREDKMDVRDDIQPNIYNFDHKVRG